MAEETPNRSLLDTLPAVWSRRKWLAILAFAAPLSAAASLITFLPNVYRSTATVLVDRQQIPEAFVKSTVTSALETRIQTISQEILSRGRLEVLINRFGLYSDLRSQVPLEQVIERMRKDIKLELKSVDAKGLREATVAFTISYQGTDAGTVSLTTNALASFYIEENLRARERQAAGTAEFLKGQLGDTKKRLDDQEQRVSEFKRRHMGELPQQMETNIATLERLHQQLRLNADNQTRAMERRQTMSSQLAEADSLVAAAPVPVAPVAPGRPAGGPDSSEARLTRLKQELTKLRGQFNEKYPDVVLLVKEVAALEREVEDAKAHEPKEKEQPAGSPAAPLGRQLTQLTPYVLRLKEALSEAEADIKVFKGEERRLKDAIASYQARIEKVPRREQEFRELARDYDSTRELYQSLLKRYEEAQLAESMEQRQKGEQFRVLDSAIPRPEPAAPNRVQLLLLAVLGSLGLAVGAVMLAERFDTSFHTVDELRECSALPVLVSIPLIITRRDSRRKRWRMRLAASAACIALALIVGAAYFAAHGNERLVSLLVRSGGS
jgi:succinoglycan biosynthesis transport protein ExoP